MLWARVPELAVERTGAKRSAVVGEEVKYVIRYRPTWEEDLVVKYSYSWGDESEEHEVPFTGRPTYDERYGGAPLLDLSHAYTDTGVVVFRFAVWTRQGETFRVRDTLRIVPK
jgi:hypothetical protein